MNNDDKVLKILETVVDKLNEQGKDIQEIRATQQEQGIAIARLEQGQERLEQGQAHTDTELTHIRTALKVVATRGDVEVAVEAGNAKLKVDLVKKIQSHERRITNLEEKTGTPNPDKN